MQQIRAPAAKLLSSRSTVGLLPVLHRPARIKRSNARRLGCIRVNAAAQLPPENPEAPWYDSHRIRKSYRSVYDFHYWQRHRNPLRYFTRLFDVHESAVLRNTMPAVMWVVGIAVGIGCYMSALTSGVLPACCPAIAPNGFAQAFVSTTTVAMSLLLVFRTTQSYNRWDEARKFWGATLNRSRDVIRQCVTLFPDQKGKEMFARWHVAFICSMHRHFQNEGSLYEDLKNVLKEEELALLLASQHRPMKALHVLGELIVQMPMAPIHQMQMSLNVQHFHDQLGACERLLRTPIPVSYTRHTARFLFCWLSLLPFALWGTCGWFTVPAAALIAVSFLKIDEIGVMIEEPFSILPLDVIAGRVRTDVISTLKDDQEVKMLVDRTITPTPARQMAMQYAITP